MPPDFSRRSLELEIMDTRLDSPGLFDQSLRQIEAVNELTLGYRPVLLWLDGERCRFPKDRPATILDIGCGRGALLRRIRQWSWRNKADVSLGGIDINPWARQAAQAATPRNMEITYRTADIHSLSPSENVDYLVCSHVTHHIGDRDMPAFLQRLDRHARSGWFIVDLHRHPLPYAAAKALLAVLPVNDMVRNDGPVSVSRGFTEGEWRALLTQAEISPSAFSIRSRFPFRHGIARRME
jgi:2-polyprenyl-3-methyl-5-hydroxy-6-metoxy-1,4-benzoquinol methylase